MPLHFCLQKKQAMLSSAQNDQSQFSFPDCFGPEIEQVFFRRRFLAPEKYDRLTKCSFWYQLTGTRNRRLKLASVSLLLVRFLVDTLYTESD